MSYQDMKIEGEIYDDFLTIAPRDEGYLDYNVGPIALPVIANDGVKYAPDVKITVNDLNSGKKTFINGSGEGDKFKVNVIINKNTIIQGKKTTKKEMQYGLAPGGLYGWYGGGTVVSFKQINLLEALNYWIKNMTIFTVTTRAADIPNGAYIITANPSRTQNYENYTVWELEFTKYVGNVVIGVTWDNTYTNKAITAYNKKKSNAANKSKTTSKDKAKQASTSSNSLSKCKVSQMKYSKTKKVTNCTKLLQKYLNKKLSANLAVDGWYGSATKKWVKKFQEKYKKKYKLTPNGNMDSKTLKAMTKV